MNLPITTDPPLKRPAAGDETAPYVRYNREAPSPLALVCDHASAALPAQYGTLGLEPPRFREHIAVDLGAAALTEFLARAVNAPAIMAAFSRLLIDPNRAVNDPTLIPAESDGVVIPGNQHLGGAERTLRIERFYEAYHRAVDAVMAGIAQRGDVPAFIGIHSFTPEMHGVARPWEIAVLWNQDDRLARYLVDWLNSQTRFTVGENEPYSGNVTGHAMGRHGDAKGYPNVVLEVRQDVITTENGIDEWGDLLARMLRDMVADMAPFTRRRGT